MSLCDTGVSNLKSDIKVYDHAPVRNKSSLPALRCIRLPVTISFVIISCDALCYFMIQCGLYKANTDANRSDLFTVDLKDHIFIAKKMIWTPV